MNFYRNKDNDDYLMIYIDIGNLDYITQYGINFINESSLQKKIIKYFYHKYFDLDSYILIAVKKDEEIGQFILNNIDNNIFIDEDMFITREKVKNALLIAIYENRDYKLLNRISVIFRDRIVGSISELETRGYSKKVLEKIASTTDFDSYIMKKEGSYVPKKFLVYENGVLEYKSLKEKKNKQYKKNGSV